MLVNRRLAHELDLRRLDGVFPFEAELKRELFSLVDAAFRALKGYAPGLPVVPVHFFHLELREVLVQVSFLLLEPLETPCAHYFLIVS